ncbi:epoxide hydrolase 1 [Dothidotthia symphoricarpi CBS 119687]|uniref:Epoxide hydrolase 1 n=1 Tax=Dothidotthia symphoricarpi CBS 119687 TaxID=1392245 RepID=A0A6A5ZZW7_9PLEO|nr:epoxide hydrolase 1 [Dothidotthia symphoricarpi CBS 119687]KAF2124826.1 epoxide hydrolase 1 [Dothidotthia symphoricarpi CBS 119687]
MTTKPFGVVPAGAKQQPTPFELCIDEGKLQDFKTLLKLSPIAKETYENLQTNGEFGVSRKWVSDTKDYWLKEFDWRKEENHINSFPNFKSQVSDTDGGKFDIHFAALFSSNPSAIPIAFFHGWPGSFLEFLPLMDILRNKYTSETLPYHVIAPSLPGFGLSSDPPHTKNWTTEDSARIMHKLLLSFGFGATGYLVQGGDIGSFISRDMAVRYPECKGMHVNFMQTGNIKSKSDPADELSDMEKEGVKKLDEFNTVGNGYAKMHATKPSTIGLVLASSPLAQLAWIGEKFLVWTDPTTTPPLSTILADITLYWLSECYPTSIYTYRETQEAKFVDKPIGYSYFRFELAPVPRAWAEKTGNMVFFRSHENGGHFAALERPDVLLADVEDYVKVAWKS